MADGWVGCGILGSATALDKDIAKQLLRAAGLPVARAVTVHADQAPSFDTLESALGLPLFIKPARQGSSVGVHLCEESPGIHPSIAILCWELVYLYKLKLVRCQRKDI